MLSKSIWFEKEKKWCVKLKTSLVKYLVKLFLIKVHFF